MKNLVIVILVIILVVSVDYAQQNSSYVETGVFNRKSVTIFPLTSKQCTRYYNEIFSATAGIERSSRYDYNFVSLQKIKNFQKEFENTNGTLDDSKLKIILLNSGVLDEIVKSSANLDSLQNRYERNQKRIVTSASRDLKIKKPTVNETITLINGTFIGITLLESVIRDRESATANGRLLWAKLDVSKVKNWDAKTNLPAIDEIQVNIVKNESDKKYGSDIREKDGKIISSAEINAINKFAPRIGDLALTMDEFKLRGTIQDISDGIRMDVGKRENAYLDQGYKLYELRENEKGEKYTKYMGFVRLSSVADNTKKIDALSSAYSIIGSYEPGYTIVSHDQSFDLLIRFYTKDILVPKLIGNIFNSFSFEYDNDITKTYNIEAAAIYNIARTSNIRQFFIGISGALGFTSETTFRTSQVFLNNLEIGKPLFLV
jgi:hypothetical protein